MVPKFLRSEIVPFASIAFVRGADPRSAFRRFLEDPATGPHLDAMIHDNAATDAAILAARDEDRGDDERHGSQCGLACAFCGRCS